MQYLLFTEEEILELVDEYQLYCFYLKMDIVIGTKYPTPDIIRTRRNMAPDKSPSLAVFVPTRNVKVDRAHEFLFKEYSLGITGNIFKLVQEIYGINRQQALLKVCEDFGLGGAPRSSVPDSYLTLERRYADPIHIEIKSRPFNTRDFLYWDRYNIDHDLLIKYKVKALTAYWIAKEQKIPSYPPGLGYSYEIDGKYQLYFPYTRNKSRKFRMNWAHFDIPGFYQLEQKDQLIITKSMKDVMCLRSYGYDAISCKGENVLLPPEVIEWCRDHYRKVYILFDNDGRHKADEYDFPKIWVPKEIESDKDISDYTDNHGPSEARKLLKSLI